MTKQTASKPKFCSQCGALLQRDWIAADQRERLCCRVCGVVHYQNPKVLVVAMVTHADTVLLCRRARAPGAGLWTPPSGFMEENETLEEAAARETLEEAGVTLDPDGLILHTIANLPSISEVYVTFRGTVTTTDVVCGPESLQVGFFGEQAIPWRDLAYPAMTGFLRMFFREMNTCRFGIHLGHVDENGKSRRSYHLLAIGDKEYSVGAGKSMLRS